jgi:membrane protease YdiL (CAAX protease family)/predicted RNA-binding Zn-ribbon protein involved in translation (DUF1610 family)
MSKENGKQQIVKHCVYCGARIEESKIYCPKCGKLVVKIEPSKEKSRLQKIGAQKKIVSRKCSGCGSIITSSVLEQCPICNAKLEKIPKLQKAKSSETRLNQTGYVFTNKKLVPEQRFIIKKETWNFREGISVFGNSLMAYIIIRLLITMLLAFQLDPSDPIDLNITTILLSQIPDVIFGLYPLWYIYSKKHNFQKLRLNFKASNFSSILIKLMYDSGINFFDILPYLANQSQVIQNTDLIWIVLLMVILSISAISTELVFRGVLHNTLKERFDNNLLGRSSVVFIIALIYSVLFLIFTLPIGIYFFLVNFMVFIFLGILYEVNKNILTTIIASIIYNIAIIVLILYF